MASGWAKDGAEQEQIDATVDDAIARIKSQIKQGESATHCEECDAAIPEARRVPFPAFHSVLTAKKHSTKNKLHLVVTTAEVVKIANCVKLLRLNSHQTHLQDAG